LTALIQKLWDIAFDVWQHRNRVLHKQEHSVAPDLEIQQITAEFELGPAGTAKAAKVHFRSGLLFLLQQQPAYQTAWLNRIQAARARAERRDGQRREQQRDTFNPERLQYRTREQHKKAQRKATYIAHSATHKEVSLLCYQSSMS
jgi:hypothetical protein